MTIPRTAAAQPGDEAGERRFFAVLLATAIVALWVLPMTSSFWLDETGTFWVIRDGLANLVARSMYWSWQSPLYYMTAWLALVSGGAREWVLRAPSLVASLAGAWMLYRLATRLFNSPVARLAVLCFVCSAPVAFAAADARPYALSLCLLIGSTWMLVLWLNSGAARYAAGYALLSALTLYAHYFLAPGLVAPALYAIARARKERRIGLWKLWAAWAATGLLMLPMVPHLLRFYGNRGVHSFASTPSFVDLFTAITPPLFVGSLAVGLLAAWMISPQGKGGWTPPRDGFLLALGWALTPPLILFAVSIFSPAKLFVPRYYISSVPGLCLAAACLTGWVGADSRRRIVPATVVFTAIVSFGSAHHGGEDWAGAMRRIGAESPDGNLPVLAPSGFVEATDPKALDQSPFRDGYFAPQAMYPLTGKLIRLPYRLDEESIQYVEARVLPLIRGENRFVLVARYQGLSFEPWLRGRMAPEGFSVESLGNFGNVGLYLFRASHNPNP